MKYVPKHESTAGRKDKTCILPEPPVITAIQPQSHGFTDGQHLGDRGIKQWAQAIEREGKYQ